MRYGAIFQCPLSFNLVRMDVARTGVGENLDSPQFCVLVSHAQPIGPYHLGQAILKRGFRIAAARANSSWAAPLSDRRRALNRPARNQSEICTLAKPPGASRESFRNSGMANLWPRKPIVLLVAEAKQRSVQALTTHDGVPFTQDLSASNPVALGIEAIIGAGIFVLTGHAPGSKTAVGLSFGLGATYGVRHGRIGGAVRPAHRMPRIPDRQT